MSRGAASFTAVFVRHDAGYLGFIEEIAGISAYGRTLDEARSNLQRVAEVVFDEERRQARSLVEGKEVLRESFAPSSARG